jgi:hypothetical protein
MTVDEHRAAVLELIADRWRDAKIEQSRYEDDMPEWAEVARGKAELLMELAAAVQKLTDEP